MAVELSLRMADRGGEVRDPDGEDLRQLLGARRLLLLIHGYNNDLPFVRDTVYPQFESLQREIAGIDAGGDYAPGWRVVHVYWPGDADHGLFSALFYPSIVKNAPVCGAALAKLLDAASGGEGIDVAIVSHSLGCRVVAELLKALPSGSRARVTRVAFFAAAAPTFMLEDYSPGSLGLAMATRIEDGAISLYSGADMVLAIAFPLGQTLAPGNEGVTPTALGHELWASMAVPGVLSQGENPGAGHSDYWGWREKTRDSCGLRANTVARERLRLGPFAERSIATRPIVIRTSAEAREVASRQTGPQMSTPASLAAG